MINFYDMYNKDVLDNTIYRTPIENASKHWYDIEGIATIRHILISDPKTLYWLALIPYRNNLDIITPMFLEAVKDRPPGWLLSYSRDVIRGRWPEVEHLILKSPAIAYEYANDVVQDRWPEAEDIIKTDPEYAFSYAVNVLKSPWSEADHIIKESVWWNSYVSYFKAGFTNTVIL